MIAFASSAKVCQSITQSVGDLRSLINGMEATGDTAIWDALALASEQLVEYGRKYPNAKRRIICLSDGLDTDSSWKSFKICEVLVRNKVVVDSICIGSVNNSDLRTVSYFTGGQKFFPRTLKQAMAICETKPALDRTGIERVPIEGLYAEQRFASAFHKATPDVITCHDSPARGIHIKLEDTPTALSDLPMATLPRAVAASDSRSKANVRPGRCKTAG